MRRNIFDDKNKDVTPRTADGANVTDEKDLTEALKKEGKPMYCHSCGKDCTRIRYHNAKNPPDGSTVKPSKEQRYDLCTLCYQEARFPSSTTSADYVKLENEDYRSIGDKESSWSDSELLLLLEALEMFDDNWESVADHVGSRTREECVVKFLQLEIEEKYLEGPPTLNGARGDTTHLTYPNAERLPFGHYDNPVMSVMSFLAGLADPATTATAAGRSVDEMRRTLRERIEKDANAGGDEESSAKPASAPAVKPESSEPEAATTTMTTTTMDTDASTALTAPAEPSDSGKRTNDLPTTALSLTAARAAALASHTERQLTAQVSAAVNQQLQKLELKLQQFGEMEALLQAERREVDRGRQRLFLDRLQFRRNVREAEERLGAMQIRGGSSAAAANGGSEKKVGFDGDVAVSDVPRAGDGEDNARLEI